MARVETIVVEPRRTDERPDFDRLVATQHAPVTRLVSRLLGWSPDAPDVVQDVFVAALLALPRFAGRCRVETWLTRIAVNACRSHRRKQVLRLRRRCPLDDVPVDGGVDGLDAESLAAVRAAVRALPARDREVIVLRYLEEMPLEEIAATLGVRKNAVEVRLYRARRRLEASLAHVVKEA